MRKAFFAVAAALFFFSWICSVGGAKDLDSLMFYGLMCMAIANLSREE